MTTKECKELHGSCLLRNRWLNRGLTFTDQQRKDLGVKGLLPAHVFSAEEEVTRAKALVESYEKPIQRYVALEHLHEQNEDLFYRVILSNVDEFMPLIYTPTVGEACQKYSHIFNHPVGLYLPITEKGNLAKLIANVPNERVDLIVVTDGNRILGLGDQGADGMGIPNGKLGLYCACAGVNPQHTLPVTLDVGTNNPDKLNDPLYIGLRQHRPAEDEYLAFVDEFVTEIRKRYPNVLIQFEDFQNAHAYKLLELYQEKIPCFNDDIQGTASVVLGGFLSVGRILKRKLKDEKILFLGAGSAATGIANLLADAMVLEGVTKKQACGRIALFDSKGLVTSRRTDKLADTKLPYAGDYPITKTFLEAIRELKPTAIVGVSTIGGAFTKEIVEEMAKINARPVIFSLSNPTVKSECTAEQAYTWTDGKALFACGSPFAPVTFKGTTFVPRQGNNSYVFPGIGFGAVVCGTKSVPNECFIEAARALANLVSEKDLDQGSLYPPLADIRAISASVATAVAKVCYDKGLATVKAPADLKTLIVDSMWSPTEPHFEAA